MQKKETEARSSFITLERFALSNTDNLSILSFDLELYFCLAWGQCQLLISGCKS